jgi:hypothetical protein
MHNMLITGGNTLGHSGNFLWTNLVYCNSRFPWYNNPENHNFQILYTTIKYFLH